MTTNDRDLTLDDFEDAVRTLESNATMSLAVGAVRDVDDVDALPGHPSIWFGSGSPPVVPGEDFLRGLLDVPGDRAEGWADEQGQGVDAPPSEAERIAAHVAAVAPGYRERARAWLDAEHVDMVEELAELMATVSAECCS